MISLWASAVKPECHELSLLKTKTCWSWRKHFPMSISKGTNQTIQDFSHLLQVSATDGKLSHPLVRLRYPTKFSSITLEPRGFFHPQDPEHRGMWPPQGIPRIWNPRPGSSLQGSSSQALSGFGQTISHGNNTGINPGSMTLLCGKHSRHLQTNNNPLKAFLEPRPCQRKSSNS